MIFTKMKCFLLTSIHFLSASLQEGPLSCISRGCWGWAHHTMVEAKFCAQRLLGHKTLQCVIIIIVLFGLCIFNCVEVNQVTFTCCANNITRNTRHVKHTVPVITVTTVSAICFRLPRVGRLSTCQNGLVTVHDLPETNI